MNSKAIIAIVAVVIVVAAGAGAIMVMNGSGKSSGNNEDFAGYEVKTVDNLDNYL